MSMSDLPHAPLLWAGTPGLQIGGRTLEAVCGEVGDTPFYAYDAAMIGQRLAALRATLPAAIGVHYAVKANPFPPLLARMAQWTDGLDVASGGELARALASGCPADRISFAGPGKRDDELAAAVDAGVLLNVESAGEVARLDVIAQRLGRPARVAVRINPDFELKGAGMRMGGGAKPFGVDAEAVPALLADIGRRGLGFEGFHLYAGSQNLRGEVLADVQRQSYALIRRLAEAAPAPVRSVNLGGGLGIPYFPGESRLDLSPVATALNEIADAAAVELPEARLCLELGRYLVGEAGVYVTRIVDIKQSRGQIFVVCDGGLNHHLAASGNFGQVLRKNYPVALGNRLDALGSGPVVSVVGPLCTPLDLLADKVRIGDTQIGDLIVVFQSGAYGASASPAGFLGHFPAREIVI